MKFSKFYRCILIIVFFKFFPFGYLFSSEILFDDLPSAPRQLKESIDYTRMISLLDEVGDVSYISVKEVGKSAGQRSLYLTKLNHEKSPDPWRLFFYAQQHGNEPAGKDALLFLIKKIASNPELLPDDVELWVLPMVNPDGAEADKRRNANDADLNRDHQLLEQPEIQILHSVFRSIMPHVAIDCHEFSRDSRGYEEKGWSEWPLIMMGTANNPLYDPEIVNRGLRWCDQVESFMISKGHNYSRYYLGGVPPDDELRYSSPEVDDARNGFGAYGGLSFIIESGVKRNNDNPGADLGERVDAYIDLLERFIYDDSYREEDMKVIKQVRNSALPEFIPVNYFWGNVGPKYKEVKVIEKESGEIKFIKTANFMQDMVIKKSVPTPLGYAIEEKYAAQFESLLRRHAIPFRIMEKPELLFAEASRFIKFENEEDEIYSRYSGRQIIKKDTTLMKDFNTGSIYIDLDKTTGKRAVLLLEPNMLYGIYQSQTYRNLIDDQQILPVWRILKSE